MADRSRLARLAPLALPPLAFLLYAATAPGLTRGDAAGVYATAAALVEHGRPAIDGAIGALAPAAHGADAGPAAYGPLAYAAGHFYHDAPPGPALLATPAYALGLALAPLLGPDAPALLVALLGPLVGALAVAGVPRLARRAGARGVATALLTLAGALLLWPLTAAPTAPLLAAALLLWLLPAILPLLFPRGATRGEAGNSPQDWGVGVAVGLGLGAYLLLDTGAGLLAMLALLALVVRSRRRPGRALALLLGVAVPALVLAAYGTAAFGEPWRLAFRYAVDPA
ncbi:MAG TPA: hypothetical protein VFL91_06335, partial [Thermomicrobiales bacterium]|nr:hypothetical protein [Thermomicrobiales bacterium]